MTTSSASRTLYDTEVDGPLSPHHAPKGQCVRTHALVIGVGNYDHLAGGSGHRNDDFSELQQVTSAPASARSFARWLLDNFRNGNAPLGSIELLLSPAGEFELARGISRQSRSATMAEIKSAFERWYQRCDSNANNIAVLYFCGHGLMRSSLALLAQDFGASTINPFDTAVDLNGTHDGMARCKAQFQFYFVDSCQQEPWVMRKQMDDEARVLIPSRFGDQNRQDAPIFMATLPTKPAYGIAGGVTIFTQALLESFERGATKSKGRWIVTTSVLNAALIQEMDTISRRTGRIQKSCCKGMMGQSVFHELSAPPDVKVFLSCDPEAATGHATLEWCKSAAPTTPVLTRIPHPKPWELKATVGQYVVHAKFADQVFKNGQLDVWVVTPGPIEEEIPV